MPESDARSVDAAPLSADSVMGAAMLGLQCLGGVAGTGGFTLSRSTVLYGRPEDSFSSPLLCSAHTHTHARTHAVIHTKKKERKKKRKKREEKKKKKGETIKKKQQNNIKT